MGRDTADYAGDIRRVETRDALAPGKAFLDTLEHLRNTREYRYTGRTREKKRKEKKEENAGDERAKFPERNYPRKTRENGRKELSRENLKC